MNKYEKWYRELIENRKINIPDVKYVEIHHIIPSCLGGNNSNENLITLTAREHYIAHLLLTKIHPNNYSLKLAVQMMTAYNRNQLRNFKFNNRIYEKIKIQIRDYFSKKFTSSGNPMYGSSFKWITNVNSKKNLRAPLNFVLTDQMKQNGWKLGVYRQPFKVKRHLRSFKWIKNEFLKISKQLSQMEELTQEMIDAGWEYGIYQTETIKLAREKNKGKRNNPNIGKKISQALSNRVFLYNESTKQTISLKKDNVKIQDLLKNGWNYGRFQTDKCKQMHEKRKHLFTLDNERRTLSDWIRKLNISEQKFIFRYKQGFRSIADILNPPTNINMRNGGQKFIYRGKTYCLKDLARISGIKPATIRNRIAKGWSIENAINPNYKQNLKWYHNPKLKIERCVDISTIQFSNDWKIGRLPK